MVDINPVISVITLNVNVLKHSKQKAEETSRMDLRSNTTIKTRPDYMLSTSD